MGDVTMNLSESVGALAVEPRIIIAAGRMSASEVAEAKGHGSLAMTAFEARKAYLELGGVALAEGELRRRGGRYEFVVKRAYGTEGELR